LFEKGHDEPGLDDSPVEGGAIPPGTGKHSGRERFEDACGVKRGRLTVSCVTQNGRPVNWIVFRSGTGRA